MTAAVLCVGATQGCHSQSGADDDSADYRPGQTDDPIVLQLVEVRVWEADRGVELGKGSGEQRILAAAARGEGMAGAPKVVQSRQEVTPVGQILEVTDGERIAGETRIALPRSAESKLSAWDPGDVTMRVCMSSEGMPVNVAIVGGSGFAEVDDRVKDTILKTWHYQPYRANGEPIPVCQRITFRYELRNLESKPVLF
jgi:hypothetical protein